MELQDYISRHEVIRPPVETQSEVDRIVDGLLRLVEPIKLPSLDECKKLTAEGLPVLQHKDVADKFIPFGGEIDRKIFAALLRQEKIDCDPKLRLIVWTLIDRLVPTELKASDGWASWRKNYCPICGRRPVLAQLRKEFQGRARFLKCDGCETMWEYNRLGCVYCGNEELTTMRILEIEAEPEIRLDVCDKCRAYLKTYNHEGEEKIYLNDRLTMHFDLLADDAGLQKCGSILVE